MKDLLLGNLVIFSFLIIVSSCKKQTDSNATNSQTRYSQQVFTDIATVSDVAYGTNTTYSGVSKTLTLDVYSPNGDTAAARPLLILLPGGGFSSTTSKSSLADYAKAIAKYGYVVSVINYRTFDGTGTMTNQILKQIILQGIQDVKAAVRFFRKDAQSSNVYKINSNKVFIGGHSAGGIVGAHTVYLDDVNKADVEFKTVINNNGGLEGNSGNAGYSSTVSGNINLSGGLIDKNYIQALSKPMIGIYGTADNIVSPNDGTFSLPNVTSVSMSGVQSLYDRANSTGISKNIIRAISGGDHFSSAQSTCTDCLNNIAAFMYALL